MRMWPYLSLIVVFGIVQVTVMDYFKLFGVKPDLLFLIAITSGFLFYFELRRALYLSICAGILKDMLSLNSFGINTLLFCLWTFVIIKLSKRVSIDNNFLYGLFIFIIVILNDIIARLIFIFLGRLIPIGVFLRIALLEALYTALISPLVFKLFKPLSQER